MTGPALITGGSGFFGRALAAELARRGIRFKSLSRADGNLEDPGQARRLVLKGRPAVIFHLAGLTGSSDPSRLWAAHVGATLNVLEAALDLPVKPRIVIAGSAAEYGAPAVRAPVKEDEEARPLSPYGASKLSQTLAALSFVHRGLEVAVARVFNASGPGAPSHLVPGAFASQIAAAERGAAGSEIRVGNLEPRRDFVDVRDIASALVALGGRRVPSGIYNVCSGAPVAIGEVLDQLLALASVPLKARPAAGRRRGGPSSIAGSRAKLARAAGWTPRIGLRRSLRDTLAWHRRP